MKKLYAIFLSIISVLTFSSIKVNALDYNGQLGYDGNLFRYLSDKENVTVDLVIENKGETNTIPMVYEDGIYLTQAVAKTGAEYYFKVCDKNHSDSCENKLDPFAYYINMDGTKNVIVDGNEFDNQWEGVRTYPVKIGDKTIYAFAPEGFTKNINIGEPASVFGKLTFPIEEEEEEEPTPEVSIKYGYTDYIGGLNYLQKLGYKYLEISDLYDSNNYFFVNRNLSNKVNTFSVMTEYQNMIMSLKKLGYNIIMTTNFTTPSEEMKNTLLSMSKDAVVDGKLNFADPIIKRYIREVYRFWINTYKVDGFYISDAQNYDKEFLKDLIDELTSNNIYPNSFVYTNIKVEADKNVFYTNDDLQNALFGSLSEIDDKGILLHDNEMTKENLLNLIDLMFSGYRNDFNKYEQASYRINNFGDINMLDIASKIQAVFGSSVSTDLIRDKVKLALAIVFSSAGVPRVVAGNEFLNRQSAQKLPSSDPSYIPESDLICKEGSSICYVINKSKFVNWNTLKVNDNYSKIMPRFRAVYAFQFPSFVSMQKSSGFFINDKLLDKGVISLRFNYKANYVGDMTDATLVINLNNKNLVIPKLDINKDTKTFTLLGSAKTTNDNQTALEANSFYILYNNKVNNVPQWVYILIALGLFVVLIGGRLLVGYIGKRKGYNMPKKEKHKTHKEKKEEKKKAKKEAKEKDLTMKKIFSEYLGEDEMIQDIKHKIQDNKEKKEEEKESKEESKESSSELKEDKTQTKEENSSDNKEEKLDDSKNNKESKE